MSLVILSGPTASGKSYLAELLYAAYPVKIINADSMQIYNALPILTSQPRDIHEVEGKYALYGSMDYQDKCTVVRWVRLAVQEINSAIEEGKTAIVVGGTGLYIQALLDGIVVIPDIDGDVKDEVGRFFENIGKEEFYRLLVQKDPKIVHKVHANDQSRMIRAMEVLEQTGRSILSFQNVREKVCHHEYLHISLFPDREDLYRCCDTRFGTMLEEGAVEEVGDFVRASAILDMENRMSKYAVENALGYEELKSYISGDVSLDDAIIKTKQVTRNYAKRQVTWFKNQMKDKHCLYYKQMHEVEDKFSGLVKTFLGAQTNPTAAE